MTSSIAAPVPVVRPAPLDRLPGTADDDPFLRLAAAWLLGHPTNTAKAYRRDLESWAAWCAHLGVHPLAAEAAHSRRSAALVAVLTFCGLRISEALGADVRDYGHDSGHRVLKVTRKGGKTARVALAPTVVRALDTYLEGRTDGPIFLATNGRDRYGYKVANEQLGRLCRSAGLP